jgi:hypothetical protein
MYSKPPKHLVFALGEAFTALLNLCLGNFKRVQRECYRVRGLSQCTPTIPIFQHYQMIYFTFLKTPNPSKYKFALL